MMKSTTLFVLLMLLGLSWSCQVAEQKTEPDYHSIARFEKTYDKAAAALDARNYQAYLSQSLEVLKHSPNHPNLIYQVASAYALSGQEDSALNCLKRIADLGGRAIFRVDTDSTLLQSIDGDMLNALMEQAWIRYKPLVRSETAHRLPERDLIPEGVAYDSLTRRLFIGSINKYKVVTIDSAGIVSDFLTRHQEGLISVLGMEVDEKRRHLWLCSVYEDGTAYPSLTAGQIKAAVFKFDVDRGTLVKKYELPGLTKAFFNDVTIASDGTAYITDSDYGKVYIIRPDIDSLQLLKGHQFLYPNGLALTDEENYLFVASYGGISRIDLKTKRRKELEVPNDVVIAHIDGLEFIDNTLIAHQGTILGGVFRYHLNDRSDQVLKKETIDLNHPDFDFPTTGEFTDEGYHYIANAQLRRKDAEGKVLPYDSLADVLILKVEL